MDGVIIVDKPEGWTSHDVVGQIRRLANTSKVGHLGTLDPMATGVLPLVVGRATRLAQFLSTGDKHYRGRIQFGWSTDTYDREGSPTSDPVEPRIDRDCLERNLAAFRGAIRQTPPPFSAKKIAGIPAYRLARKKIPVELAPVEVEIFGLDLVSLEGSVAEVTVHCSTGTYLRSIAHDLGRAIGCGAFLTMLHRTAVGGFRDSGARSIDELRSLAADGRLGESLIPASELLPQFPAATVDQLTAGQIRQGRDFRISPFLARADAKYVKAIGSEGELIAIGEARLPHLYHPILVF